jgi:hypothetical protein
MASSLTNPGIPAEILKVNWRDDKFHHDNFESVARRVRFQLLGKACSNHGIESLLLAHHQDDQVETVLMRMIKGHKMQGLTGIKAESEIPECYGLHGVHESGVVRDELSREVTQDTRTKRSWTNSQISIEGGGVKVYRPLLAFGKDELRRMCQEAEMQWFEDHTNKDPTLTMRNAIRHLYSQHALPKALSKQSILSLCERANKRTSSDMAIMNQWLRRCKLSRFETRSGFLTIKFPLILPPDTSGITSLQSRHIASLLIRRVIMLVTPNEHIELSTLTNITRTIFPELFDEGVDSPKRFTKQTVAGVLFDPMSTSTQTKPQWLLSRQMPAQSRTGPSIHLPGQANKQWSPWQLFDGRYWMRVKFQRRSPLGIELFRKEQMASFVECLDTSERNRFKRILKDMAPGGIRWTLPAIIQEGIVVALPTLGVCIADGEGQVEWEVRYTKVDLNGLPFSREMNRE